MFTFLLFVAIVIGYAILSNRISRLEDLIRAQRTDQRPQPGALPVAPTAPVPPATPAPAAGFIPAPVLSAPIPPPPVPAAPAPAAASQPMQSFEFKLGSKFFTAVGSLAVILGVGFFLRYAFEKNLITETMRVVLGLAAGFALVGTGEYLRKKFEGYGQVLVGTGLALFYLTLLAAANFYGVFSPAVAFFGMVVVTAAAVGLAIKDNSLPLAGFAQLGGFVTAFMVPDSFNNLHKLFLYVSLLDIGMLLIALKRSWRILTLGSLFGTAWVYLSWHVSRYDQSLFMPAFGYLTLFFLIFLAATLSRLFVTKIKTNENDLALILFNPLFYFLAGYALIHALYPDAAGLFAFGLSALYLAIGFLAGREEATRDSKYFLFGVGFLLLFIGIPVQFGNPWVTVGWAAEALVLHFLGRKGDSRFFRNGGLIIGLIAGVRFLSMDLSASAAHPWFNQAGFTLLLVALCLTAATGLYRISRRFFGEVAVGTIEEQDSLSVDILSIELFVLLFAWVTREITQFYPYHWLAIGWSLLAFFGGILSIAYSLKPIRLLACLVFVLAGFRLLVYDSQVELFAFVPFVNFRVLAFLLTAFLAGVFAYVVKDSPEVEQSEKNWLVPVFFYGVNLLLLWLISAEVLDYYNLRMSELPVSDVNGRNGLAYTKNSILSVIWALYAVTLLGIGIAWKSSSARLFSVGLFGLVIFKVFLYDTANLNNLFRFVSFISLGLILLLTGYLYNRYKERISEFILTKN